MHGEVDFGIVAGSAPRPRVVVGDRVVVLRMMQSVVVMIRRLIWVPFFAFAVR